jgi:hypothetical protein
VPIRNIRYANQAYIYLEREQNKVSQLTIRVGELDRVIELQRELLGEYRAMDTTMVRNFEAAIRDREKRIRNDKIKLYIAGGGILLILLLAI